MVGQRLGQGKVLQFLSLFQDERWGLCSYLGINQLSEGATCGGARLRGGHSGCSLEGIWRGGKGKAFINYPVDLTLIAVDIDYNRALLCLALSPGNSIMGRWLCPGACFAFLLWLFLVLINTRLGKLIPRVSIHAS